MIPQAAVTTAQEHFDEIHPRPAHGTALFWDQKKAKHREKGAWSKLNQDSPLIPKFLAAQNGHPDRYITVNEFRSWRITRNLSSLRAVYVDIDGSTDVFAALDALSDAKMPEPSLVIYSGRGMHLYWLLDATPAQAIPVWQLIENALVDALKPLGADPAAKDCTRVLRLCGTINSKNGAEVHGRILSGLRWTLHELANEVLGYRDPQHRRPKAKVRSLNAEREGRKYAGSIYHRWYLVYRDLIKIAEAPEYLLGGIPEGGRDKWLFLTSVALSWYVPHDRIVEEIARSARIWTPGLLLQEITRTMKPVINRAEAAARGEKVEWQGQEFDPRYRFKRQTLYDWMQPIIPDSLLQELRAIIPDEQRAKNKREWEASRSKRDRVAEGRYSDRYTGQGVRACNEEKRATARLMRASGTTIRAIAESLGVGSSTVGDWLRD
jgi:hypothetical protein